MTWLIALPSPGMKLESATHRKTEQESQLADGREEEGGRARSYDREKAWSSIHHSILWNSCHEKSF